ncbi:MAG: hypothetical protein GF331_00135 [Chitinivibrionales bacterium]|nr:hypothetical protein [Chitinivibrionales bacterium]
MTEWRDSTWITAGAGMSWGEARMVPADSPQAVARAAVFSPRKHLLTHRSLRGPVMALTERERILRYLDQHGVIDKDEPSGAKAGRSGKAGSRRSRGVDYELDLHGMTQERAARALRMTLKRCRRNGVRSVLVIHGQGLHSPSEEGAVLRKLVRAEVSHGLSDIVRNFKAAPPRLGGNGATIVYLH